MILATTDGCGAAKIMRRSGKSKSVVWNWQARFIAEGVDGLARDRTRKPGKAPLPTGTVQRVRCTAGIDCFLDEKASTRLQWPRRGVTSVRIFMEDQFGLFFK